MKVLAENKKAYHDYQIIENFEAGIVLNGQEVKSIRLGRANLRGAFVVIKEEEAFLLNADIPAYQPKNAPPDYDSQRSRKLLLKKAEIKHLIGKSGTKGLTLVPLRMYTQRRKIKIEIGIAKSKSKRDKREVLKKRASDKEMKRELKLRG
ncbi:MAG: SsrA-binding protein SmpB [Patescibacteria group bacterium]|nr:SsrA-binding protein SmpB [Patescibacteria group bacterium]